ncbi:MAG: YitT family protein [Flavobacteriales bacterium]|nr:YitT family protein [Flavobacteriales bacterium]
MPHDSLKTELKNYLFIIVGAIFLATGMVGFLIPNKIATGGIAGLSIIFHHLFKLPTGVILMIVNIPLLFLSLNYLGKQFAIRTIITIVITALFIDLLGEIYAIAAFSDNTLLSSLYGGVFVGIGLGLIFKGESSAGAGTIIAKILNEKANIKTGDAILILDALVVVAAGVVFKDIELALWSLISIYVSAKLINLLLTGSKHQKIVHIALDHPEKLQQRITEELGITGTLMQGNDLYNSNHKNIIFIVVDNSKINVLKKMVHSADPKALMIVMEATELLGSSRYINGEHYKRKLFF